MKINFLNTNLKVEDRKVLKEAFKSVLKLLKQPNKIEVNLAFADPEEIKIINKQFRGIDKSTDVLSFPAYNFEAGEIVNFDDSKFNLNIDRETKYFELGDCLICLEIAQKQASEFKHELLYEIIRLFVHSLFHLFGYDHILDIDYKIMSSLEEKIMLEFEQYK